MPDGFVRLRKGEKRPVTAQQTASSGTLTLQPTPGPSVTLYDGSGSPVAGISSIAVTGYDTIALANPRVWFNLDTSSLAPGVYELAFVFTAQGSDGIPRIYTPLVQVQVTAGVETGAAGYPGGADVEAYLLSLGLLNPATATAALILMRCDLKAQAAAQEFEQRVEWFPYLSDGQSHTRYYDPPGPNAFARGAWSIGNGGGGRNLELRAGLLSLISVTTGITPTFAGTLLTQNTDFYLSDGMGNYNADQRGLAFTTLEFTAAQWGGKRSIAVVGKWGQYAALPTEIFEKVKRYAARLAVQELRGQISNGVMSRKDLNTEVRYGNGSIAPLAAEEAAWGGDFDALCSRELQMVF